MPRPTLLLIALIAVLGFGFAYMVIRPMPQAMTEAQVRTIVTEALAAEPAPMTNESVQQLISAALAERDDAHLPQSRAQLNAETLNPMIEDYLLSNPRILQRVSEALQDEIRTAEAEQAKAAIESMKSEIYDDPDHVVLGNPNGDVTLVEMFDYNCGFCRQALPDLATLIAEDPNLKVVLKEFPILSPESVEAARVAILVSEADVDYWTFHQRLFTSRGMVTGETALAAAKDLGLNPVELQLEMQTPKVDAVLGRSYDIARALRVSGTPTYIIGDEVIPGAVGIDALRERIANMRACGKSECSEAETGVSGPQSNS